VVIAILEILDDMPKFVWLSQRIALSTYSRSLPNGGGPPTEPISRALKFRHCSVPHPSPGAMLPLSSTLR
jgi:hypothetical protein